MLVTAKILEYFSIRQILIIRDGERHPCEPADIESDRWIVTSDSGDLAGNALIQFKHDDCLYMLKVRLAPVTDGENFTFTYEAALRDDGERRKFDEGFRKIREHMDSWNKRREERYDIGLDEKKIAMLSLRDCEQAVICEKTELPAAVSNISYSGARLVTAEGNYSKNRPVFLMLSFVDPIETVPITCAVRNHLPAESGGVRMSVISVEFVEPPVEFNMRMEAFIKRLTDAGKKDG